MWFLRSPQREFYLQSVACARKGGTWKKQIIIFVIFCPWNIDGSSRPKIKYKSHRSDIKSYLDRSIQDKLTLNLWNCLKSVILRETRWHLFPDPERFVPRKSHINITRLVFWERKLSSTSPSQLLSSSSSSSMWYIFTFGQFSAQVCGLLMKLERRRKRNREGVDLDLVRPGLLGHTDRSEI